MKNLLKSALVAIVALATGLTACQKNGGDDNPNSGETKTMMVKLFQPESTRAAGDEIGTTDMVTLKSAYIYFTRNTDNVVANAFIQVLFGDDADEPYNNAFPGTVGIDVATAGFVVKNIPNTATGVHVVANLDEDGGAINDPTPNALVWAAHTYPGASTAIATVLDDIHVASQKDAAGGVDNVSLYGVAPLEELSTPDGEITHEAEVELYPIVSRLEIGKISGAGDSDGDSVVDMTGFTLEGIWINNIYRTMAIDGSEADAGLFLDYENVAAFGGAGTAYAGYRGILFDDGAALVKDGLDYSAGTGKVWAYNLLAPTGAEAGVPHIILKISGISLTAGVPITEARFITIGGFIDADGDPVTAFLPGHIYTIDEILFGVHHTKTEPEQETYTARITVTPMEWVIDPLDVVFN